jgi:CheY-like chemotaxis protein/predicted regulator of Ras-like GTPase activity (Roadblock/LC7/MglB family)
MTRILVVDDSLSVRKALEKILATHAEVSVASSAEDALTKLRSAQHLPHLLITDVLMPGMNGFDLTREIKKLPELAGIPVVLISGIIDDEVHRQMREVGADAVVRKPFTAEELLPVIQKALGQATSAPPEPNDDLVLHDEPELLNEAAPEPVQTGIGQPQATQPGRNQPGRNQEDNIRPGGTQNGNAQNGNAQAAVSALLTGGAAAERSTGAQSLVDTLAQKPGVLGVLVTTRDGHPRETAGSLGLGTDDLAMYARFFASTAATLGARLQGGGSSGVQMEYDQRTLLILPLDEGHLLVCLLSDVSSSSVVRFAVRRQRNPLLA